MAKALLESTTGYADDAGAILRSALFDVDAGGGMVLVRDIEFHSLCEHHMLPFFGSIHVAYLPGERVVGLSKLARVADVFSKRLQVQERITRQIADAVMEHVGARGCAVVVEARCVGRAAVSAATAAGRPAAPPPCRPAAPVRMSRARSHLCMCMRGASKPGSMTTTSCFRGVFAEDDGLRREFLAQLRPRP